MAGLVDQLHKSSDAQSIVISNEAERTVLIGAVVMLVSALLTRQDELGRLAVAANTLRDFLADTFSRLKRSTTDLDTAGGELNAIAELMAQGTHEQFERTDQVATAMTEMSATAQEVARHAAHAARAADEADQSAQDGETVMQSTIATITRMRNEISSTADVIQRLETDSGRIGKVLEVIRGIAG